MPTEQALGEFYERHARDVWTYVYHVTNNATDADDIVQEAFLRLFQTDLPSDEETLRRYVFRVAGNLIADRWRRRVRDERHAGERAEHGATPAHDPDVVRIFSELKPRERALLWLAYVEEDTHADIAQALRLTRGSVKVMLSRARARLRDLLTARGVAERLEK
ncbi:MAG: RNA polymerase sigma factor [Vicinamibacterales bacterium]